MPLLPKPLALTEMRGLVDVDVPIVVEEAPHFLLGHVPNRAVGELVADEARGQRIAVGSLEGRDTVVNQPPEADRRGRLEEHHDLGIQGPHGVLKHRGGRGPVSRQLRGTVEDFHAVEAAERGDLRILRRDHNSVEASTTLRCLEGPLEQRFAGQGRKILAGHPAAPTTGGDEAEDHGRLPTNVMFSVHPICAKYVLYRWSTATAKSSNTSRNCGGGAGHFATSPSSQDACGCPVNAQCK